jgi:MerR family mercuric resistance operon transcriptional regulator
MPTTPASSALTIGQLAGAVGVPTSTVRYYERVGLFKPDARTRANYRCYTARAVERLRFIRAAQAAGFSLEDVRQMLALTHSDESPCGEMTALINRRLDDVRQRLRDLKRVERTLANAVKSCCKGGADWCAEVERLQREDGTPPATRRATPVVQVGISRRVP